MTTFYVASMFLFLCLQVIIRGCSFGGACYRVFVEIALDLASSLLANRDWINFVAGAINSRGASGHERQKHCCGRSAQVWSLSCDS